MTTKTKRASAGGGSRTPSGDLRAALVDAAEAVLVREGPEAVTVRAVAAEAGVAPMGVYNRFGSKEGLIDALLIRGFEGLQEAVVAHGELDPMQRLRASGVRYRMFALTNRELYSIMFGGPLGGGERSPEVVACGGGAFEALVGHVGTAIAAGKLIPGEPAELAQQIWCAVHGAVILEMQSRMFTPDPDRTYQSLIELVLRGLMTDSAVSDSAVSDSAVTDAAVTASSERLAATAAG